MGRGLHGSAPRAPPERPLLGSLVKAGCAEALGTLERVIGREPDLRADAQDYLAILRLGVGDWADIVQAKSDLETARLNK